MKNFRKIVDERQEKEMMQIERSGFWIMLFILAGSILVQLIAFDINLLHIAGESVAIIIGCMWIMIGFIRRGLWDYFSKPGTKSYVIYSVTAAFLIGSVLSLPYLRSDISLWSFMQMFAVRFLGFSVLGFLVLSLYGIVVKTRMKKLQEEYEDENNV